MIADRRERLSKLQAQKEREKVWFALLLAAVAGTVDAVGYLLLLHLFTAHMSGNSVAMGLSVGQMRWQTVLLRAVPIPLFVFGVALGTAVIEVAIRQGVRSSFSIVLSMEALLLIIFIASGGSFIHNGLIRVDWQFYLLVALLTLSMGLQTATLQRVGGSSVRTTYVTGMLTDLSQESVKYLFWLHDHTRGRTMQRIRKVLRLWPRHTSLNRAMLLSGIWCCYVCGAIWGGYAELRWELGSLGIPLCILVGIIVLDLIQPIYTPPKTVVKTRLLGSNKPPETSF